MILFLIKTVSSTEVRSFMITTWQKVPSTDKYSLTFPLKLLTKAFLSFACMESIALQATAAPSFDLTKVVRLLVTVSKTLSFSPAIKILHKQLVPKLIMAST